MPESDTTTSAASVVEEQTSCESPPPAPIPAREDPASDARTRLLQLAAELTRSQNRRLVVEYLRLRRAI